VSRTARGGAHVSEMIEALKAISEFSELYEIHRFEAYRRSAPPEDALQRVEIVIRDAGAGSDQRYHVTAKTSDGRQATGNPHSELLVALGLVHWGDLG